MNKIHYDLRYEQEMGVVTRHLLGSKLLSNFKSVFPKNMAARYVQFVDRTSNLIVTIWHSNKLNYNIAQQYCCNDAYYCFHYYAPHHKNYNNKKLVVYCI